MNQSGKLPRSGLGPLVLIAAVLGGGAAAFAYTAGWLSPGRLTPDRMIEALTPPTGAPLGEPATSTTRRKPSPALRK